MALAETTLSSAVTASDRSIVVASATSFAAGRLVQIGGEMLQVTQGYSSGTTIPVLRGRMGTASEAHVASQRVVHGDAADFNNAVGSVAPMSAQPHVRRIVSYTGTTAATCDLPKPGEDLVVVLNGSAINTLTVPVPTKDLDGCMITLVNSAGAAHVITFTGGFGGASTSYDVVTLNATGTVAFSAIACNEVWVALMAVPMAGTVTNITGTVA
jgi:hypothetical protein